MVAIAWERLTGSIVGQNYLLDRLISGDDKQAWFQASEAQPRAEPLAVACFPAGEERPGWPGYILDLRHPNLRLIVTAGQEPVRGIELRYIVMERAGAPLSELLAKHGRLSTGAARQLGRDIAGALQYLHRKNLVHRGVKPEGIVNIGGNWKLGDFSLLRPAAQADPQETRAILAGSPQVPPDAFTGLISPAWDIYSLGVTLNRCLVGDEDARGGHRAGLPAPFELIVRGCLEPDPRQRLSLDAVARLLGPGADAGERESKAGASSDSHASASKPKRRRRVWMGILALTLLCEAMVFLFLNARPAPPMVLKSAPVPEPQPVSMPAPSAPEPLDPVLAKGRIGALLRQWISTVQQRDLEGQVNCYAPVVTPFFGLFGAGVREIRREKQLVFQRIGTIRKMSIDMIEFESLEADRAVVSLRKEWDIAGGNPSSGAEDERLTLRRIDGEWKIAGEEESNVRWIQR